MVSGTISAGDCGAGERAAAEAFKLSLTPFFLHHSSSHSSSRSSSRSSSSSDEDKSIKRLDKKSYNRIKVSII
jgi:hypothetical protein